MLVAEIIIMLSHADMHAAQHRKQGQGKMRHIAVEGAEFKTVREARAGCIS